MARELLSFSAGFLVRAPERKLPSVSEEEREWQVKFFSGAGNYLRNELAGIMGFVQMAADEVESKDLRGGLKQFEDFRVHYLRREELLISLQGRRSCERFSLQIRSIWREVKEILEPELLNRVKCEIAEPEEKFSFDSRQMPWAVAELVRNGLEAVKRKKFAGGEQGMVKVVFALGEGSLKISVADNGEGMDKEVSERLSNPQIRKFRKGVLVGKIFTGPGFGLAIARSAVDNHGGGITFKTSKGEGSIFTITIR